MKITNEFAVNTPIDRAWAVLTDLEGIAPCLPGARLTGVEGDTYTGRVKVKVGPVVSDFAGTARFLEKDEQAHRAVIDAKGRDARSAGNAAAVVTAQLRPDGDRTLVSVDTDLKISGKLAQFGSGMIKEVSGKLLNQFVQNLEAKLAADGTEAAPPEAAPPEAAPAQAVPPAEEAPLEVAPAGASSLEEAPVGAPDSADVEPVLPRKSSGFGPQPDDEALDLLGLAGGSVYKRLIPIGVGVAAVAAVIVWVVVRR
ncbi:SRPBCC family protein [Amorphoplanes digitatis]|uniref:Carbon monoxide dehydrogenase subunit G n=1 Tax=Actinoplanes digitatis TaxID=1868 RepID=A0A7W7MQA7_9ACTN|nr:SRPBCC family protein [Actinoplanes digitatis]MBB4762214.1 carbon monoxide dehydrogenase subunit G [Actinoplanes digitatis]GID97782.1 carbon monoxide dehydrogenase subunit G (CoxG) family protein [Actinoplanes digitatis]